MNLAKMMLAGAMLAAIPSFGLPAGERVPDTAKELLGPAWRDLLAERAELADLFGQEEELTEWLASAEGMLTSYFGLEDPRRLEPEACELLVEAELPSGMLLRGYIDRLDVAPTGEIRVVDYKTGAAPRKIGEAKAMFQMKFYALVLWRLRGVVPRQLLLMYLSDRQNLAYQPDEAELRRFERTLEAIWNAILKAGKTGDFRPNRQPPVRLVRPQGAVPGVRRHAAALPRLAGAGPRGGDRAGPSGLGCRSPDPHARSLQVAERRERACPSRTST